MLKGKSLDAAVLIALPILAALVTVGFGTTKFVSTLLFFGVPAAYLVWRKPEIFKKSVTYAFLLSLVLSIFIDTLAVFDQSWYIPYSIVPYRLFGAATFEVYIFGLLWGLFAVLFYEYFFDRHTPTDWFPKAFRKLLCLTAFLISAVVILFFINPALLVIPYFYTWVSVVFVVSPLVWFVWNQPKFLPRLTLAGAYFFLVLLLFEFAALEVGQWSFPGEHFIGWVELLSFRFPMEEFVFWLMFATPSLLAYYEFFADDRKL